MPRILTVVLCCILLLLCGASQAVVQPRLPMTSGTISEWLSTPDGSQVITAQPAFSWQSGSLLPVVIQVGTQTGQRLQGFGASLTDTSSFLIGNSASRTTIMQRLFAPYPSGINLSLLRQPLGCSDFCSQAFYTYDDVGTASCPQATDPALACFSLGHDTLDTIPLLQQALALNPALQVMMTPWSAPAWMKTSGSLLANSGGTLITGDEAIYAQYLVKALQAYQTAGIPVTDLTMQNEPGANAGAQGTGGAYPGMDMTASQEATLLNDLAPDLQTAGLTPGILMYDWNAGPNYPLSSFTTQFKQAPYSGMIAGTALHCYGGMPAQALIAPWLLTECSPGIGPYTDTSSNPFASVDAIIEAVRDGASGALEWNLAENQSDGPRPQGASGCTCTPLVTVETGSNGLPDGNLAYTNDFTALGQVSSFVQPGADEVSSQVDVTGPPGHRSPLMEMALLNPDGSMVLVVHNETMQTQYFSVTWQGQRLSCGAYQSTCPALPAGAIATFEW